LNGLDVGRDHDPERKVFESKSIPKSPRGVFLMEIEVPPFALTVSLSDLKAILEDILIPDASSLEDTANLTALTVPTLKRPF
jgi:hypothetical protein